MAWITGGAWRLSAARFLKPDGRVMLEFGDGQAEGLREIFQRQKWIVEAVEEDYSHRPRIMVARRVEHDRG
jgi:methylase of polypeptide subunit release factors